MILSIIHALYNLHNIRNFCHVWEWKYFCPQQSYKELGYSREGLRSAIENGMLKGGTESAMKASSCIRVFGEDGNNIIGLQENSSIEAQKYTFEGFLSVEYKTTFKLFQINNVGYFRPSCLCIVQFFWKATKTRKDFQSEIDILDQKRQHSSFCWLDRLTN